MGKSENDKELQIVSEHPELKVLHNRGWRLEVVKDSKDLVRVPEGTLFGPCIDGRPVVDSGVVLNGFKIPGGVYLVMAAVVGRGDEQAVAEACDLIEKAGFVPTVHGDEEHKEGGCGFARLLKERELPGLPKLEVDFKTVKEIVEGRGGVYVELKGNHSEQSLDVVLRRDSTLIPNGEAFVLNPQAADILGMDRGRLVGITAQTIELLNGPRIARVYL